jgi:two-component system chemotaxis response regulator CheB
VQRETPPSDGPATSLVVVGASAGGVEALVALARALPADLDAAIVVVLHLAPHGSSVLSQILGRHCALPVHRAAEIELQAGHMYVAPPDRHVIVRGTALSLSSGPKENGHRPAIDPAMRTAAEAFGASSVGVLLSGTRDDGVAGLLAIKRAGGRVLVQDPEEALYDGMPRAAIGHVDVDAVLPVAAIAASLAPRHAHLTVPVPDPDPDPDDAISMEDQMPDPVSDPAAAVPEAPGDGTRFTCPDCGGVLFSSEESGLLRFRCSVGHQYSPESLLDANIDSVESALWAAVRIVEDRVALLDRMARRARESGNRHVADTFEQQAHDLVGRAATIRSALGGLGRGEAA